jgi:4-hydroxy-tetrahydrodipicolinate synthase
MPKREPKRAVASRGAARNGKHDLTRLRGSIPPLITPFSRGEVDYDKYAELVEFQIEQGSHGILVNGTTSEPSTLTTDERNRLVTVAITTAAGRVPVVAATGSQSLAESRELTDYAVAAGADALLIVTPYYIRPPQRGLVAYYLELVAKHDVPWMIYHIPGRTAVNVTLDTLKACKEKSEHFVGIKHAVNDLGFASECLHEFGDDFKVFVGLEELSFPMMAIGACGLMNAVGNLRPGVLAEMCEAVFANDLAAGRKLHDQLLEINKAVFYDTNPIPMKYMMMKLGLLAKNEHRLPMVPATAELAAKLDGVLERAGLGAAAPRTAVSRRSAGPGRRVPAASSNRRRAAAR